MSSRDMTLEVVVKLRDLMDAGVRSATGKLDRLHQKIKQVSASVAGAFANLDAKLGALGIGAGVGLAKGLESFVLMDAGIRDVGVTLNKSGKELERFVKGGVKDLETLALMSGQTSQTLTGMWNVFAQAGGLSEDAQRALLIPVSKATTAASADPVDMAKLAVALYKNAGLKSQSEIEQGLAILVQAGKLGSVELKNMAADIPTILANQANLGLTGLKSVITAGANVEISRNTTGTPGEAATNYKDFLTSINTHHTIKRFADHGVDLPGVLADAAAKGINPVDAVLQKVSKIINQPKVVAEALARAKGRGLDKDKSLAEVTAAVDAAVKAKGLGELFVNQQQLGFLIARELGKAEYGEMVKVLQGTKTEIIDTDHASRMAGPEAKQRMAGERVEQVIRRFGDALTGIYDRVGWVAEKLQTMIDALDRISPAIVDTAVQLTALVGALSAAVLALKMMGFGGGAAAVAGGAGTAAAAAAAAGGGAAGAGGGLFAGLGGLAGRGASFLSSSGAGLLAALGFASFALQQAFPTTKEGMAYRLDAGPIDFAAYERAWREEKEWRRDPEAARGRAMMDRGRAFVLPEPIARDAPHDPWLKVGSPNLSFESITGSKAPDLGYGIAAAFAAMLKATGIATAKKPDVPPPPQKVEVESKITVKVDGPGVVTSQSTSTTGDRGQTVGRP